MASGLSTRRKVLVSWSSGKDSAWMVQALRSQPDIELRALLTTVNGDAQRVAMHAVRLELLHAQADALGLPLWPVMIPSPCPNDVYEREMAEVVARAVDEGLLPPLFPLFGADTNALAAQMVQSGLRAGVEPGVIVERDGFVFADMRLPSSSVVFLNCPKGSNASHGGLTLKILREAPRV